jgi:polar amino acid transport system substrate-binding protein
MAFLSKRTFLTAGGLAAGMLALGPIAAHATPPQPVTLLLGDALDAQGRQKPLKPWRRKLFDYLEQELNIVFDIKTYPWPRAERNARNGAGLIFGLPKNADRLRDLRYSDTVGSNTLWLVTRSDATFPYRTLDDLRGKTVGAVRGYTYGDEFERRRNKIFRVDNDIASRAARLQRLLLKRVDALLLVQPSWESAPEIEAQLRTSIAPYARELNLPPDVSLSVLPQPVQTDNGEHFAIAYGQDNGLIDRINAALARQRDRSAQR